MTYYDIDNYFSNSNIKTDKMFCPDHILERGRQVDAYITEGVNPTLPEAIAFCETWDKSSLSEVINLARPHLKFQHEFYRSLELKEGLWFKVKAKPDILYPKRFQLDIKTTSAKTMTEFNRLSETYDYARQMGLYKRMCGVPDNALIVISKYGWVEWRSYTNAELDAGFDRFRGEVLKLMNLC